MQAPAPAALPPDIVRSICRAADRQVLGSLQHVAAAWRHFSLPLLWRNVEMSEWECKSSAGEVHATYGRHVRSLEYRQCYRRRGSSLGAAARTARTAPDGKTKTDVICGWLGLHWGSVRQVAVGAWPPYNVHRVLLALAAACPHLRILVLEGAAAAWLVATQHAVNAHPLLQELHISEDPRALLPPAADRPYQNLHSYLAVQTASGCSSLTRLTAPCLADAVIPLLARLPSLLPALRSLDLRQVDTGVASRLCIALPPLLEVLRTSGHHPLSVRMFSPLHAGRPALAAAASSLRSLEVAGPRSEEAARSEFEHFWSLAFMHRWPALTRLVAPVVCADLAWLIRTMCPSLRYLHIAHTGSSIDPQRNTQWVRHLTQLASLCHLDIASSNNEYEGCRLSPRLVSDAPWLTAQLRTLYLSRLALTADGVRALLCMLPRLQALWFSFDVGSSDSNVAAGHSDRAAATHSHIRYLIVHSICTSTAAHASTATFESDDSACAAAESAVALAECLRQFPSLNRCRLPMFTFPDTQRRQLQIWFPHIDFQKYVRPF
ncbi:hypothetical protein H4R21_004538 [Coemansia helicoidea]|uniref:Uncharacterized protein n=1 Tax=Coemansia helicoidea TaxID=1286919 RepID=A0ACC1KXE1_9FUNG|nr:hypothetical protein H4R21_004538 [Coemansia helicoidea]